MFVYKVADSVSGLRREGKVDSAVPFPFKFKLTGDLCSRSMSNHSDSLVEEDKLHHGPPSGDCIRFRA